MNEYLLLAIKKIYKIKFFKFLGCVGFASLCDSSPELYQKNFYGKQMVKFSPFLRLMADFLPFHG